MVNYMLMISAEFENLSDLQLKAGCDDPEYTYYFKLKCGSCGEVTQKETCLSLNEEIPSPLGRGNNIHLQQKCKFCTREGTIAMITGKGSPLTLDQTETGKFAPIMLFDCRGFEPVDFVFGNGWKAISTGGTTFDDIDLSGGEFAEYDEKGECPVMISNLRAMFKVVK